MGRLGGQGGGDDGKNNNKVRGKILRIPPFVRSLPHYLIRKHNRNWNRNQNWNQWSRRNTNRSTRYTASGNHPRRSKRSSIRRRVGGLIYYEKEEDECEDIIDKEIEQINYLSLLLMFLLLIYVFDII